VTPTTSTRTWLSGTPLVFDTTYRLPPIAQRHLL
jgi:hypothetical protein